MRIELHDGPIATTPAMITFAQTKLAAAVGHLASLVDSVRIVVRDTNGPKGGVDTRCSLHAAVNWKGHSVLVAEDHGPDYYAALTAASRRLRHALRRLNDRKR
jgi:putative sigma-54 modulation protein